MPALTDISKKKHFLHNTAQHVCQIGTTKYSFSGIREQRVTHILIFALIGISVKLSFVLKFIPMPVLYGVFLYMGVASLNGIQFFDRLLLFFMPKVSLHSMLTFASLINVAAEINIGLYITIG